MAEPVDMNLGLGDRTEALGVKRGGTLGREERV